MKKMNKKGFTLAELLIVIAIIAVLIAIAIPTFSGALENARLQTDHANIRSAYAMAMNLNMDGYIDVKKADGTLESRKPTAGNSEQFFFQKDGTVTVGTTSGGDYKTQAAGSADKCKASIPCDDTSGHTKNVSIIIHYDTDEWVVTVADTVTP